MRSLSFAAVAALLSCGWLFTTCRPGHAADTTPEPTVQPTLEDHALAARAEKAIIAAQGTPGQEAANMMSDRGGWVHYQLELLKGARPATARELQEARENIGNLTVTAEKGPTWPMPALRDIPYTRETITIDGKLDDHAWRHAATWQSSYVLNEKTVVTAPLTTYHALWDAKYLYVAFDVTDNNILPEPETSHDDIYFGDCVEIFLLPDMKTVKYWELIFNPAGDIFQALHTKLLEQWGPAPGEQPAKMEGLKMACLKNKTGYTIEAALPFSQFPGFTADTVVKNGQRFRLLLARFDKSDKGVSYMYNQPMLAWGHNIWNYGTVELVK